MQPGELYWALVESVWDNISIYDGPETFLRDFAAAPRPNRNLFAAHWCISEVCNGGFDQFFSNSTGVLAPEAAAALNAIGMPRLGSLVEQALARFGGDYPRDRDKRQALLEHLRATSDLTNGPFERLDDQFYQLIGTEAGGWEDAADNYARGGV